MSIIVTKTAINVIRGFDKKEVKKVADRVKYGKLPAKLQPDFGQWVFSQAGTKPILIEVANPGITINAREAYISFTVSGRMATVITDKETALKYLSRRLFIALVKASPDELYQTTNTKEWVIPFRIVKLL